jgi:7-carboxy-7-deazaguanine synthase
MTYSVKEIFYTLQGEGANTGRPAVFCRFAGCNLWTGLKEDRAQAVCQFCDTDFVGTDGPSGGKFSTPTELTTAIDRSWRGDNSAKKFLVCTGGEPLLQLDAPLIESLHAAGFEIAVETNGTITPPLNLDWVCVSPKANADIVITGGDELKLVYPQDGSDPSRYDELSFTHWFIQPMDGPARAENSQKAVDYCLNHPKWKLSLQTHKFLGIP